MIRIILLARKPLREKSISENVLEHGSGGINIDGTRIATKEDLGAVSPGIKSFHRKNFELGYRPSFNYENHEKRKIDNSKGLGRWPANMILQHKVGCRKVGTGKVKKQGGFREKSQGQKSQNEILKGVGSFVTSHYDHEGAEIVEQWECTEGCPVHELGGQSGHSNSTPHISTGAHNPQGYKKGESNRKKGGSGGSFQSTDPTLVPYKDSGTAARFFKQVQVKK